jgi:hypothetical protein
MLPYTGRGVITRDHAVALAPRGRRPVILAQDSCLDRAAYAVLTAFLAGILPRGGGTPFRSQSGGSLFAGLLSASASASGRSAAIRIDR